MKTLSIPQPYAAMACVSADYGILMAEDTDYRGKVLICANGECAMPEFVGLMREKAMCVMNLASTSQLTEEQLAEMESKDKRFVWNLEGPRLVNPFDVPAQDGLFDHFADIEYLGSAEQFREAYEPYSLTAESVEVVSVYALLLQNHFPEISGSNPFSNM